MCKGCEIRTRLMVSSSAELDALRAEIRDALANGHDDGHAAALGEILPRLDALAVRLAGPTLRAPPSPPQEGEESPPSPSDPAQAPEPAQPGFTHAARVAAAMERSAA